jgi:hypothetical protein
LPRTTAEKGVVFELGATLEPGRAHLDADAIDRAIAETKWKNTTLADIIRKGVPLLADMKEVGILLLPDQDSYVQHRGSMQKKQVEERGEGHYLLGDWLLPRFPCVIHPKGSAARTDGKRRITNNWSAPHEGHRARRPGLPLSYNERVRSVLTAPEWPRIAYNKPTDVGQAMWVLWGAGFKLIKLKADFQSYFRQFALTPRRTCLQVWGSEVGIILDTRAEFGPADMPDMASQLSDLFVRTWGQRVESRLVSMGYYDTDETAAAFRAARAGKFHGRQLWCHVESGYVDDMQGVAPEGLPAEIQRQVLHGMCDEWNLPHAPEKEEATTGDLGYTGFVYSTEGEHPTMALTKDKRERYVTTFRELAKSTLTTRAALEGAVGKAIHAAVVSPEGKADMDGLYRCLLGGASARTNGPRSARHLSRVARAEAAAWAVRVEKGDKIPLVPRDTPSEGETSTLVVRIDASLKEEGGAGGYGWWVADTSTGHLRISYGLGQWTATAAAQLSTGAAELGAATLGAWMGLSAASAAHQAVLVITDSTAAWGAILRNTRSSPQMERAKRMWWTHAGSGKIPVYPEYRPREWNQGADALSKGDETKFLRLATAYGAVAATRRASPPFWEAEIAEVARAEKRESAVQYVPPQEAPEWAREGEW